MDILKRQFPIKSLIFLKSNCHAKMAPDSFFLLLNRVVQSEPWIERDRAMIDQLPIHRHLQGQGFRAGWRHEESARRRRE